MFKRNTLSILVWGLLILILSIPILNLIFLIWGFLAHRFSKNVRNFIVAYIILYFIFGVAAFQGGFI